MAGQGLATGYRLKHCANLTEAQRTEMKRKLDWLDWLVDCVGGPPAEYDCTLLYGCCNGVLLRHSPVEEPIECLQHTKRQLRR